MFLQLGYMRTVLSSATDADAAYISQSWSYRLGREALMHYSAVRYIADHVGRSNSFKSVLGGSWIHFQFQISGWMILHYFIQNVLSCFIELRVTQQFGSLNVTLQVLVTSQASSLQSSESYKVYMHSICTSVHPQKEQFAKVTGTREHLWSVWCFDYCWGPTCGSALRCRDLDQRRHPRFQARSPSSGTMWDLDWMILEWFINASSCHDL